jgi:Bacterial Ig domain
MKPRVAHVATILALVLALVAPAAIAAKGGNHGGGGKSCTPKTPAVVVDNNWAWGSPGSYGIAGQELTYAIDVVNYDVGCASSSFVVGVSAPDGFSVSLPTSSISLKSASSGYLWAQVTSPSASTDGDYPLTVTVQRGTQTASTTSWYKVYSSDTVAPTLYWPSPGDGATISGRSYNVAVSSTDNRAVKKIDLYLDNVFVSTKACDNVSYSCQLNYSWPTSLGQHTATFKSYDWMGNVGVQTTTFTVN